jgi:hypothetical protein
MIKQCPICRKSFKAIRATNIFCSNPCKGKNRRNSVLLSCAICRKQIKRWPSCVARRPNSNVFCSIKCKGEHTRKYKTTTRELSGRWTKGTPSYKALHDRVRKKFGKPKKCLACGSEEHVQWANKSRQYIDEDDFISLCAICHSKYDRNMLQSKI